jgi:hypothetical protein
MEDKLLATTWCRAFSASADKSDKMRWIKEIEKARKGNDPR